MEQHHAAVRDALQERATAEAAEAGKDKVVGESSAVREAAGWRVEAGEDFRRRRGLSTGPYGEWNGRDRKSVV